MMKTAALLVLLTPLAPAAPARAGEWSKLAGQCSGITAARAVVLRSAREWESLWKEHTAGREAPLPEVDFSKEAVVAVFAGLQRTGGYSVSIDVQDDAAGGVRVLYAVKAPRPDGFRITMLTQPFAIMKIPKPAGSLVLLKAPAAGPSLADQDRRQDLRRLGVRLADLQKAAQLPAGPFAGL